MSTIELLIYFGLGLLALYYSWKKSNERKNYPPGPWGYPILGHLPRFETDINQTWMKWTKDYGPIFSIQFGQFPAVIVTDLKMIKTALGDMDFSGRPDFPIFTARSNGIVEGVTLTHGKKWIEQRRFVMRTLRDFGFGKKTMEAGIQEEISELIDGLRKIAGKPQPMQFQFNAATINALWNIITGERFSHGSSELRDAVAHLTTNIQRFNVRGMIANLIPFVARHFPASLTGFQDMVDDIKPVLELVRKPIAEHKATVQIGQPRDLIDVYLEEMNSCKDPASSFYKEKGDISIDYTILDLFQAGGETTSTTLIWELMFLAKNPAIQKKLQAEIRAVVGNSRLPSLTDKPNLPYTEAVINETLRMSVLVPGHLRSALADSEIGGYTIPKGTIVIGFAYAVHFSEEIWGDPFTFRPERFINAAGQFVKNEALLSFSTGKRACIGEALARDELFLFTASLFQVFSVAPATTAEALDFEPNVGPVRTPKPQDLIITEIQN